MRILSSKATAHLLTDLAGRLDARPRVESAGGVDVARRIRAGERADLLVLALDVLRALEDEGFVGAPRPLFASEAVLATTGPTPALDTVEDLLAVLHGARRIAYSTGPSGTAFHRLLQDWGLDLPLVQAPPGTPVGTLLTSGEADVGVQQRSELSGLPGVVVVGPLPGRAALRTIFAGGVATTSRDPAAAAALLDQLVLPSVITAHGMEPLT